MVVCSIVVRAQINVIHIDSFPFVKINVCVYAWAYIHIFLLVVYIDNTLQNIEEIVLLLAGLEPHLGRVGPNVSAKHRETLQALRLQRGRHGG